MKRDEWKGRGDIEEQKENKRTEKRNNDDAEPR